MPFSTGNWTFSNHSSPTWTKTEPVQAAAETSSFSAIFDHSKECSTNSFEKFNQGRKKGWHCVCIATVNHDNNNKSRKKHWASSLVKWLSINLRTMCASSLLMVILPISEHTHVVPSSEKEQIFTWNVSSLGNTCAWVQLWPIDATHKKRRHK